MTKEKLIPKADLDDVFQRTGGKKDPALSAMLLEYQNQNFGPRDMEKERRQMLKTIEDGGEPASVVRKSWKYEKTESGTIRLLGWKGFEKQSYVEIPAMVGKLPVTETGAYALSPESVKRRDQKKAQAAIETVRIPETIQVIGKAAFYNTQLKEIEIPGSVRAIEHGAFAGTCLEEAVIPDSVKKLGPQIFYCCVELRQVRFPKGIKCIPDGTFASGTLSPCCKALKAFDVPHGVTKIGNRAFMCAHLEQVTLPDTLKSIGERAFMYAHLREIAIPASVQEIGEDAFKYCYGLKIYAPAGSYAEQYAKEHDIPFVAAK